MESRDVNRHRERRRGFPLSVFSRVTPFSSVSSEPNDNVRCAGRSEMHVQDRNMLMRQYKQNTGVKYDENSVT